MSRFSRTKTIVEGVLCIALSVILAQFRLFRLPLGDPLTLELAPLLLFAWRRGAKWGCGAGALFSVSKILLEGYILNPIQAILDYPLAFACVGLAALCGSKWFGVTLAAVSQTVCHVISGVLFFAQYAPEGQSPWVYSLLYNVPIVALSYAVSGVVACFLWRALERLLPKEKAIGENKAQKIVSF